MNDGQQPNPVGRPTRYDPKYCEEVIGHMEKGYSLESFGGKIGVARSSLYEWMKQFPEFSDSVRIGTEKSLLFFETIGTQGMVGKIKGFNNGVYALTMANKHKWRQQHDVTSDGQKLEAPILYIPAEEKE